MAIFEFDFLHEAMKTIKEDYGLTARQQTISYPSPALRMGCSFTGTFLIVVLTTLGVVAASCQQESRSQDAAQLKGNHQVQADTIPEPNVNIKVNRRYDDKGNLIGFDSTYSTFYSNVQGDTLQMDSLMKSFDTYFDRHHSRLFDKQFNALFFQDSIRYPDFFHDDFFMKRYELNDRYLKGMMQRMDSIKNRFYRDADKSPDKKDKRS